VKNWVKLNLHFLGISKKLHLIFRSKGWSKKLERILNKPVFNEEYTKIGHVKDIFGPIKMPFISIKKETQINFNPNDTLYMKI